MRQFCSACMSLCVSLSGRLQPQSRPGSTSVQWILHPGRPERHDDSAAVWVQSGSAFGIVFHKTWHKEENEKKASFTDIQSLLPSSFESSGHLFLAPRWLPSRFIFLNLFVEGKFSVFLSCVSSGNTAKVCIFLTTTPSSWRTSSCSCCTCRSLMNVRVLTEFAKLVTVADPQRR